MVELANHALCWCAFQIRQTTEELTASRSQQHKEALIYTNYKEMHKKTKQKGKGVKGQTKKGERKEG